MLFTQVVPEGDVVTGRKIMQAFAPAVFVQKILFFTERSISLAYLSEVKPV